MRAHQAVARSALRWAAAALALASLLAGCRSLPQAGSVSKSSSVLAVDVRFPFPLGRDPTLIRVHLARGPVHAGMQDLPPIVATSFVKGSRAYLLDPEPGTYSLVAVAFDYAPPLRADPAAGVSGVVASGSDAGQTIVLPEALIRRTRTSIGEGMVKFMGALEIRRGERIHAGAAFEDELERAIAERIRPGVTAESGLGAMLSAVWTADRAESTFADGASHLDAFQRDARRDFGASPWAELFPEPSPDPARARRRRPAATEVAAREPAGAPVPTPSAPIPAPAPPPSGEPLPEPAAADAPAIPGAHEALERADEAQAIEPAGPPVAALHPPPGHPLAAIEIGMTSEEVGELLGEPDARERSRTRRAWIPFYTGPDAHRITWIYTGRGRVVFSVDDGLLEVIDVVYAGAEAR